MRASQPASRKVSIAAIAAVLMVCAAHARDTFRIEYFDIQGSTARELRADLSRVGPVGETGVRGDGYTEYRIAWRYDMTEKNGRCRAHDIEVDLAVRMMLPRWNPPPGASRDLVDTWQRFSALLREHEDGHHRLAVEAAQEVRRKLRRRGEARDCKTLEAAMTDTANDVLREYREKQAEFDRRTDYGRAGGNRIL